MIAPGDVVMTPKAWRGMRFAVVEDVQLSVLDAPIAIRIRYWSKKHQRHVGGLRWIALTANAGIVPVAREYLGQFAFMHRERSLACATKSRSVPA